MLQDPQFTYQVGRLVGAAEMAGQLLQNQETPDIKQIGDNLSKATLWFFEDKNYPLVD